MTFIWWIQSPFLADISIMLFYDISLITEAKVSV